MRSKTIIAELIMCLMLLVLPAVASDYTLGIYGNANEDDTINMQDVTFTELIILEYCDRTELADAKYDDEIDILDITQIELIILRREKELTVLDSANKIVTVSKPVNKIIAVYSNVGEAIRALGAKDRVIGVDGYWFLRYAPFFPDLSKKSSVGGEELDIEAILELEPDVVFLPEWHTPELEDKLKGTGIDVVHVNPNKIETLRKEMMLLGYVLDEVENTQNYFEWHDKHVDEIIAKVSGIPEDEKITVFIDGEESEISAREDMSDHFTTWEPAGGKSITNIDNGERMVETEWILDQNPDVIIGCRFDGGYKTDDESPYREHYEEILGLPGFEHVNAVQYDRVHVCFGRLGMGLHTPVGISYTAKWLYPDLFEDLDPQAIHQEYIDSFCPGLDFDVSVHGMFVYPTKSAG